MELYLDILRNATQDVGSTRLKNHPQYDFCPLRCNIVSSLSTLPCEIKWTTLFGTNVQHEEEIVIPCATCVVLDHPGPFLKLLGGIDKVTTVNPMVEQLRIEHVVPDSNVFLFERTSEDLVVVILQVDCNIE